MELLDEITSYVDNEIKDCTISARLQKLIADDRDMRKEYIIQKTIKNLLSHRLAVADNRNCICEKLRNKILKEIDDSITNKK